MATYVGWFTLQCGPRCMSGGCHLSVRVGASSHRSAPGLFLDVTVFGNHFTDITNSLRRKILLHFSPPYLLIIVQHMLD